MSTTNFSGLEEKTVQLNYLNIYEFYYFTGPTHILGFIWPLNQNDIDIPALKKLLICKMIVLHSNTICYVVHLKHFFGVHDLDKKSCFNNCGRYRVLS